MSFLTVFKRYELKYMMTSEQKNGILDAMSPYMLLDKYGRTTIRNNYYDTDDYRLWSKEKHGIIQNDPYNYSGRSRLHRYIR